MSIAQKKELRQIEYQALTLLINQNLSQRWCEMHERKSAFSTFPGFSYEVSWEMANCSGFIETKDRFDALKICAKINSKHKACCYKIDCKTGERIEKIA